MLTVLIVDDEPNLVEGLADHLESAVPNNTVILKAYSGTEAVGFLKTNRPDLVISDIKMPNLTGFDLISLIERSYPGCRVIFLTGYAEFELAQRALRYTCCVDYILKTAGDEVVTAAALRQLMFIEEKNRGLINVNAADAGREPQSGVIRWITKLSDIPGADIERTGLIGLFIRGSGSMGDDRFTAALRSVVVECFPWDYAETGKADDAGSACLIFLDAAQYEAVQPGLQARFEYIVERMNALGESVSCVYSGALMPIGRMRREFEKLRGIGMSVLRDEKEVIIDASEQNVETECSADDMIALIKQYIEEHISDPNLSQSTIARTVHYAPSYLSRLFRQKTGINMSAYIAQIRIDRARALLLEEGVSIKDVGKMVGVASPAYFSALFRRQTGMTPIMFVRSRLKE